MEDDLTSPLGLTRRQEGSRLARINDAWRYPIQNRSIRHRSSMCENGTILTAIAKVLDEGKVSWLEHHLTTLVVRLLQKLAAYLSRRGAIKTLRILTLLLD